MWRFLSLTRHENQLPVLLLWDLLPWWDSWGEQMHFDNSIDFVHIHNYFNCNFFFLFQSSVLIVVCLLIFKLWQDRWNLKCESVTSAVGDDDVCVQYSYSHVYKSVRLKGRGGGKGLKAVNALCICALFHAVQVKCSNVHKVISIIREEKRREGQSGGVIANKCF